MHAWGAFYRISGIILNMIVDLRSDTVTRPTPEMYEAIVRAPVGDDVLGDDPTVIKLEELAAEMTGKESALFVTSGTMGNQIALAVHTNPGDAILIEEEAHMVYYEVGGSAMLAQVVSWTLPSIRGTMAISDIEKRILKRNLHNPGTRVLCVENTHNRAGGAIIPLSAMAEYRAVTEKHGMILHLDGARVFNASVALGVPVKAITGLVDSVSVCLSKGLRSPVGSVLCGPADFIEEARIWRKRLGGGMRQSGILAACGLVSLTQMVDRLAEDHARAKRAATALQYLPGLSADLDLTETNIVLINTVAPAEEWQARLEAEGVRCFPVAANRLRLVFHADVDDAQTDYAISVLQRLAV